MGKVVTRKEKETKKKLPKGFQKIAAELTKIERLIVLEEMKQSELEKRALYA